MKYENAILKMIKIKKLRLKPEAINMKARYFNFSMDRWSIPLNLTGQEIKNREYVPMMNYIYPLPESFEIPDDWRKKLCDTTIVEIDGEYWLALTVKGKDETGKDMRWSICRTYINLGYYPPIELCNLPDTGMDKTRGKRKIIEACLMSAELVKLKYEVLVRNLKRMEKKVVSK